MANSSCYAAHYVAGKSIGPLRSSELFCVLGPDQLARAGELIANAVLGGARAVVIERGVARGASCVSCSDLAEGVSYFFVRSLEDTLAKWHAVPALV